MNANLPDLQDLQDECHIRQMVERWAVWRDAGDWERFATVWHKDGVMMATWFRGLGERREYLAFFRWLGNRSLRRRRTRDCTNQNDDFAARHG